MLSVLCPYQVFYTSRRTREAPSLTIHQFYGYFELEKKKGSLRGGGGGCNVGNMGPAGGCGSFRIS